MELIQKILAHEVYQSSLKKIEAYEEKREFCKHDRKHFIDVCRLAYQFYLENSSLQLKSKYSLSQVKEMIYAAGLLHDIGRWMEYEKGIKHHEASLFLAEQILSEVGFKQGGKEEVLKMISEHRNAHIKEEDSLAGIFYRADKASRECFWCPARERCNWSDDKKNLIFSQ